MNILKTLLATAALLPVIASAQVNHRQYDQHRRIEHGVRSGALTHREAAGLRAREAAIRAQERRDRFFHHGHLTGAERARLNREQSRVSHDIYHQKHDAQHRHY